MQLKDKKTFITGGSKGIGKAIAQEFVKEGADVIICGRSATSLNSAVEEISVHGSIDSIQADISNLDDVSRISEFVRKKWDSLDILFNNASILGERKNLIEYSEQIWVDVMNINLNGQFFVTKALLPYLLKFDNASIININSGVGYVGKANWGAYSVSKFGMEALNQILADELQHTTTRSNSVDPGGTRTDMRAEAYPQEDPMTLPTPEDIMPIFFYLASDRSIGVSGKTFKAREWIGK